MNDCYYCGGAEQKIERIRAELETERMRVTACGVVAMANTPETAARAREMHPDYWCASVADVARMVDSEMALRARVKALEDALRGIRQYGSDTLSGPTETADDRKWYRDGVLEMTRRARVALEPTP